MSETTQKYATAFVGTPNSGKSTLFNALTGLRQKVGNFPGVTVDPAEGTISLGSGSSIRVIDLPGVYSLAPKSADEDLTVEVLGGRHATLSRPSSLVIVMEATNLAKSLYLYSYLAELAIPSVVVVTMVDAVKAQGGSFDDIGLSHRLGIPVLGIIGHKGIGIEDLKSALANSEFSLPKPLLSPQASIEERHAAAAALADTICPLQETDPLTQRIDNVVLHPLWGPLAFIGVMLLFFQSIFSWATPLMDGIESLVEAAQGIVEGAVTSPLLADFIANGILAGVGAVVVFLPQIVILYVFITLLEDFGYLARAAFMVDRFMGFFGLQGRSFIPLLGSYACAIPGIMSARIIPSPQDRLTTILVAPLMTCSARLPVYVLLITAFVPATYIGGFIGLQGLVLTGLYALGGLSGLLVSKALKSTVFKGDIAPFYMELPPYRMPRLRNVLRTIMSRATAFLKNAGTVILVLSMVLWALGAFPRYEPSEEIADNTIAVEQQQLEQSALGTIGKAIQPVFAPLGFDWKITIGVLGSFAAREVFVSVMGQVYAADVSESDESLREVLRGQLSLPIALSILVFYVFALQCMSTIAVLRRESGSWKWAAVAFGYTFILAYIGSLVTYQIALALA